MDSYSVDDRYEGWVHRPSHTLLPRLAMSLLSAYPNFVPCAFISFVGTRLLRFRGKLYMLTFHDFLEKTKSTSEIIRFDSQGPQGFRTKLLRRALEKQSSGETKHIGHGDL